jgi:hypothetical protein
MVHPINEHSVLLGVLLEAKSTPKNALELRNLFIFSVLQQK